MHYRFLSAARKPWRAACAFSTSKQGGVNTSENMVTTLSKYGNKGTTHQQAPQLGAEFLGRGPLALGALSLCVCAVHRRCRRALRLLQVRLQRLHLVKTGYISGLKNFR